MKAIGGVLGRLHNGDGGSGCIGMDVGGCGHGQPRFSHDYDLRNGQGNLYIRCQAGVCDVGSDGARLRRQRMGMVVTPGWWNFSCGGMRRRGDDDGVGQEDEEGEEEEQGSGVLMFMHVLKMTVHREGRSQSDEVGWWHRERHESD